MLDLIFRMSYIPKTEETLLKKASFLLFVLFILVAHASMAQESKDLTIIYTNDVIGEVEPCG